jgi:hypothetical protein
MRRAVSRAACGGGRVIATRPLDLSPEGLARSAAMIREAMPRASHVTPEFLHWEYVANPAGAAVGLEAFEGDRLVSHCAVQPLRAKIRGRDRLGAMSLNAATLAEYGGRGIYFGLAKQVYAELKTSGYDFGIAVTNDNSTPGFVKHCGFELLRPLEARVGLGPVPASTFATEPELAKSWDAASLAWRLSPPHRCYRVRSGGGVVRVFAPSGKPAIEVEIAQLRDAPASALPAPSPCAPSPLRLWVGLEPDIRWGRSLLWNLPGRLRPSPLNLIFADLHGADLRGADLRPDPSRVRWTGIDFDDF